MIYSNYQSYGKEFGLRLRFYQEGETKFISVNKLLKGNLLKRHWNQKKQRFIQSAPFSEENNEIIAKFKHRYDVVAATWQGSMCSFFDYMENPEKNEESKHVHTFADTMARIISDVKKRVRADGTIPGTYENYAKLEKRIEEYCKYRKRDYGQLLITDIDAEFVNDVIYWVDTVRNGSGVRYVSKDLHSTLSKATDMGWFDMDSVKGAGWVKKNTLSVKKNEALTEEQCRVLLNMRLRDLPRSQKAQLYYDFCILMLYTCQSPCDAICMKYSNIKSIDGVKHLVFKRRKIEYKQSVPCTVPINPKIQEIIDRWRSKSKDGYILPIRSKATISGSKTNNFDIKHFNGRLNLWLKKLGKLLGVPFPLHSYVFRHTGITHYVSKGVPVVYVANLAGTSVENIEKIYYSNVSDVASRDKVLSAVTF